MSKASLKPGHQVLLERVELLAAEINEKLPTSLQVTILFAAVKENCDNLLKTSIPSEEIPLWIETLRRHLKGVAFQALQPLVKDLQNRILAETAVESPRS